MPFMNQAPYRYAPDENISAPPTKKKSAPKAPIRISLQQFYVCKTDLVNYF